MTTAWPRLRAELGASTDGPHEARLLRLDNSKARARLGWAPALSLDETVDWTVAWYRAVHENTASARTMLHTQLDDYRRRTDDVGST
jgi:CDP-glucose 4,6-dehydratase